MYCEVKADQDEAVQRSARTCIAGHHKYVQGNANARKDDIMQYCAMQVNAIHASAMCG